MGQPTSKTDQRYSSLFSIRGGKDKDDLHKLAGIAWIFVSSCLWNSTQFSSRERQSAKDQILAHLRLAKHSRRCFLSLCERILIARFNHPPTDNELILPSVWLDLRNKGGFETTRLPYMKVKALRESLPQHLYEWKALAEAVLDFGEDPTGENFRYWKNYFTEKQASGLLQLFQVFVSNIKFSI